MNLRVILVAGGLLLAACATTPRARFVLLASDAYGCGAAEGLGCGLAIAPVLDELDELDGVVESSVSWDGTLFRLEVLEGADADRVVSAAALLLEGESCCAAAPRGGASPAQPDQWFNSEQTVALSRHEAGVIASGSSPQIAAAAELGAEAAERLHGVLREELEHAFERAHAEGGGVHRLREQLPRAREALADRLGFLTSEQRASVLALVDRKLEEQ